MKKLLKQYTNKEISQRQFITIIKKNADLIEEVNQSTEFLDNYDVSLLERIYYVINDMHKIVKCRYCDRKAKFTERLNEGYKTTCCNKECESKRMSEQKQGLTKISENRDTNFINWQMSITSKDDINDKFIIDNIKYDKHITLLTNPYIIDYLTNRYDDSSSLMESYQRIKFNVDKKPVCPVCGKPVNWVGKKSKLYTRYCSDKCSANSKETQKKKKQTQLRNWGTENCYDSEKYKNKVKKEYGVEYISQIPSTIKQRKDTLIKKYNTTNLYKIEGVLTKLKITNNKKYGVDWVFQRDDIRDKIYKTNKFGTSKSENIVYDLLTALGYEIERFKRIVNTNWCVDFYLPEYDIYIEYQGSQYHNGKSYLGTEDDINELNTLRQKNIDRKKITHKKTQYETIINTWSVLDVKKRNWMVEHNYNFLELYDCLSEESLRNQLEFYIDCLQNNITELTHPIKRRKIIQALCKRLNKKESQLTSDELLDFINVNIPESYNL